MEYAAESLSTSSLSSAEAVGLWESPEEGSDPWLLGDSPLLSEDDDDKSLSLLLLLLDEEGGAER